MKLLNYVKDMVNIIKNMICVIILNGLNKTYKTLAMNTTTILAQRRARFKIPSDNYRKAVKQIPLNIRQEVKRIGKKLNTPYSICEEQYD